MSAGRRGRRTFTPRARLERSLLILARKPNYDFEKRRKELDRKAKKDAKREERLQRKQENAANGVEGVDPDLEGIVLGPQPTGEEEGEDTPE